MLLPTVYRCRPVGAYLTRRIVPPTKSHLPLSLEKSTSSRFRLMESRMFLRRGTAFGSLYRALISKRHARLRSKPLTRFTEVPDTSLESSCQLSLHSPPL